MKKFYVLEKKSHNFQISSHPSILIEHQCLPKTKNLRKRKYFFEKTGMLLLTALQTKVASLTKMLLMINHDYCKQ